MVTPAAQQWITKLNLQPHPEGGWFSEVYKSPLFCSGISNDTKRHLLTHIYFLLTEENFSAFHRIKSDELWHFYAGDPLVIYDIDMDGQLFEHDLTNDPSGIGLPYTIIKAGNWFASRVKSGGKFALVGCSVAPGFDFADFDLATAFDLSTQYPDHEVLIRQLTRQ